MQKIPLPFRILLGGWFLAGWLTVSAAPSTNSQNYLMRMWQVEQGLPQNKVTSVVQTRDGYLWIGTYSGLARFDGVRFAVFDDKNTPEMHSSRVTSLFESDNGTLWIGHENGDLTTELNGTFRAVALRGPWEGGKIWAIGGQKGNDEALTPQSVVEVYDPATDTWSATKSLSKGINHISSSTFVMGGRIAVMDNRVRADFPGPPLHHHDFDELFWVLDGELTFQLGDEVFTRRAGELAFAPRGVHHTFANHSGAQARTLVVCTPAGPQIDREAAS